MGPEKMGSSELGRNVQSLSNENWTLYPFFATRQKPCRQLLQKVKSKSDQSDFQALVDMRSRHFACLRGVQMAWVDARSSAASSACLSRSMANIEDAIIQNCHFCISLIHTSQVFGTCLFGLILICTTAAGQQGKVWFLYFIHPLEICNRLRAAAQFLPFASDNEV